MHYCCIFLKEVVLQKSGIDRLIPDVMIDDFQFDPCGYSMNGLMRSVPVSPTVPDHY